MHFFEFARAGRKKHSCVAVFVLSMVLACGGCGSGIQSEGMKYQRGVATSGLEFEALRVDLGAVKTDFCDYVFPFHVCSTEAIKIARAEKSCGCLVVGDDIIGQELEPGQRYELPVRIDLRDKLQFDQQAVLVTNADSRINLSLHGVHEAMPVANPRLVQCDYTNASHEMNSGKFFVHRVRHQTSAPLMPDRMKFQTGLLEISFVEPPSTTIHAIDAIVIRETLEFKWELLQIPERETLDSIQITWLNPDTTPTDVRFRITQAERVRGLPKQLHIGQQKAGSTWRRTLTMYTPHHHFLGQIVAMSVSSPSVQIRKKEIGKFTILDIEVTAPETPGRFDEVVDLHFAKSGDTPESIRISGSVSTE